MLSILIESVDRTSLVKQGSLSISPRADERSDCKLTIQTTAATFLPSVGQDLQILDAVTADAVGTGDGAGDTFYLHRIPILAASETIKLAGVATEDYTLDDRTGELVFTSPPGDGVAITADYSGVVFGGVIKTCPYVLPGVALGDTTRIRVDITSDGYYAIPGRRTIVTDWVNETAGGIVTYLIDTFLADEGITAGTIDTGATIARYKRRVVSIKEVLDDLAKLSGFKWWIDDTKALHFTQEAAITEAAHDLVEGGTFTDFRRVRHEERLDQYCNKVFVKGGVLEDGSTYVYTLEDTVEIAARAAIEGGTGVYGYVHEDSNITNDTDGAIVAENLIKLRGRVPITLAFHSFATDWRAGTKMLVNLPTLGIATDTYFLIDSVTIRDIGEYNLESHVTASRRDGVDFSTQRRESWTDYFGELVSKAKQASSGEGLVMTYLVDKNADAVELTTGAQRVLTKTFALEEERAVMVDIAVQLTCQASQMITGTVYLDGDLKYTWKDYFFADGGTDSKQHIWDVSFPIEAVAAGQRRISVYLATSTSTADIAAGGGVLTIATRGIGPAAAIMAYVTESLTVMAMPSAPVDVLAVSAVAGSTITEGATVPDMVTVADSLLVVYERHQDGDDSYLDVYGVNFEAQTFRVGVAHTCDTLMLKCLRVGSPGTATVGLYAVPTATLTTSLVGDNNDLVYTALGSGADGNDITVAYVDPSGASQSLSVVVTGTDIAVNLATDGEGDITTTAGDIITAIEADEDADALVSVANAAANDGTGVVTEMSETALAGGANTPTGAALATQTFDGDTITDAAAGERVYVTIAGQSLTAGTMYAIVLSAASGDASNLVRWRNDSTSPAYTDGGRAYSSDSGSSWAADTTRDYIFEEGDQQ